MLNAAKILEAEDLAYEDVEIPEWPDEGKPGVVRMTQLNAEDAMAMSDAMVDAASKRDGMFIAVVACARNPETRERLLSDEDIPALRKKSLRVLNRLQTIALRLNNLNAASEAATKKD